MRKGAVLPLLTMGRSSAMSVFNALLALLPVALAAPAPIPVAVAPHPMITPPPTLVDRTPSRVQGRDVLSSIEGLETYLSGVLGSFPSYVASGVPNFFQDFPTGTAVQSTLGISSSDLAATPTQVLNIPYVRRCWRGERLWLTDL
jgi:hypothetical protein